jgi:hypothetical protein
VVRRSKSLTIMSWARTIACSTVARACHLHSLLHHVGSFLRIDKINPADSTNDRIKITMLIAQMIASRATAKKSRRRVGTDRVRINT